MRGSLKVEQVGRVHRRRRRGGIGETRALRRSNSQQRGEGSLRKESLVKVVMVVLSLVQKSRTDVFHGSFVFYSISVHQDRVDAELKGPVPRRAQGRRG